MKVGTVCYATDQGLGYLAKDFYDNGVVTDAVVLTNGRRVTHPEWYPGRPVVSGVSGHSLVSLKSLCRKVQVMLFFETPFAWELIPYCRGIGVKTVLMPMYECMTTVWPHQPDAILNPSLLDQRKFPNGEYIPVPVGPVKWQPRTTAEVFVHNAGHGGLRGRNGTAELITAMQHVKSPLHLIIRTQENNLGPLEHMDSRIEVRRGTFPRETLYDEGDVFVFPEKFNGLSLPLQEATASGMAVMTTSRFPNTEHLPSFIPLDVSRYDKTRVSPRFMEIEEAIIDPRTIANAMDSTYGSDVSSHSYAGKDWAMRLMSWDILKPRYIDFLQRVLTGDPTWQ